MSVEDEINEIENYIKKLEMNDESIIEAESIITDGVSKGLIYDYFNPVKKYRSTMYSSKIIQQEEYNYFQQYVKRCQKEEQDKYLKWKEEIINSGVEYSKDELKYFKII
jgi:hypothetical protein